MGPDPASRIQQGVAYASDQIHGCLCPRIAVLSSPDVRQILRPNGFADFAECLRPFENSIQGVTVRTSQLESKQCPTFPVRFDSVDAFTRQPRPSTDLNEASRDSLGPSIRAQNRHRRPEEVVDVINSMVAAGARTVDYAVASIDISGKEGLQRVTQSNLEEVTPWFADARNSILQSKAVNRHETFGHPVAVLLTVSTRSADPLNAFSSLFSATQTQNCDVFQNSPFVDPNILRYYVLLHDESQGADIEESKTLLESVKKIYGLNCCILPINCASGASTSAEIGNIWKNVLAPSPQLHSRRIDDTQAESPDLTFAAALNDEDVKRLKGFVRELVAQGLVPWMERCVSQWNEFIAASRKGLTGRLFGAGRKFFGSSASRSSSGTSTPDRPSWNVQGGFYPHAALEAQTRRLADFAFMTHDYKLAASMYDIGRKEYANDKAFQYAAGATEMFGLSHLMMMMGASSPPIDVDSYLASACALYRTPSNHSHGALLRPVKATLLYYEAYRALNFYRPAPAGLIRAAEDPEADLEVVSAILFEQAAFADLHTMPQPSLRKWALHMTMAGHKYRQSGAKQLSLRCFKAAKQAYDQPAPFVKEFLDDDQESDADEKDFDDAAMSASGAGWALIQDHVEYELGRQAFNDGDSERAVEHFLRLIHPQPVKAMPNDQPDMAANQKLHEMYVQELLAAFKSLPESSAPTAGASKPSPRIESPWPFFRAEGSYFSCDTPKPDRESERKTAADGKEWHDLEHQFLRHQCADSPNRPKTLHSANFANTVEVNAATALFLHVKNPLAAMLTLSDIKLTMRREGAPNEEEPDGIRIAHIEDLTLQPLEERTLSVDVTASSTGKFRVAGLTYSLAGTIPMEQSIVKHGKRLNATREQRASKTPLYAPDESLAITVTEPQPSLEVLIGNVTVELGLGEEREISISFRNTGKVPLSGLCFLTNLPEAIQLLRNGDEVALPANSSGLTLSNDIIPVSPLQVLTSDRSLAPGEEHNCQLLLRGCELGEYTSRLLFAFESGTANQLSYASQRATILTRVYPTVNIGVDISPSLEGFAYNLTLSAVNMIPSRDPIKVTNAVLVSPRWQSLGSSQSHGAEWHQIGTAFASLPPMQSIQATIPIGEQTPTDKGAADPTQMLDHTFEQLRALLIGRDVDLSARPGPITLQTSLAQQTDRLSSPSKFLAASKAEWRRNTLRQHFPTMTEAELARTFTLYQPEDLDVLVDWESNDGKTKGQVFIFGLSLGPARNRLNAVLKSLDSGAGGRSLYEETAKQRAAFLANLEQSSLATEEDPLVVDFDVARSNDTPQAQVPVTFRIRNMSTTRSARSVIDLDSTIESEVHSLGPRKASWVGRLTLRSEMIPPRGGVELKAMAARPDGGSVAEQIQAELGDWSIKAEVLDHVTGEVLQKFNSGRLRSGKMATF
ncbi:unnamed protein product [Sympodiomycopsis kandeliae]